MIKVHWQPYSFGIYILVIYISNVLQTQSKHIYDLQLNIPNIIQFNDFWKMEYGSSYQ